MSTIPNYNPPSDRPADDGYTGLPKWVKWTLLTVLAVIVILVLVRLVGGGNHGPGRHASDSDAPATAVLRVLER